MVVPGKSLAALAWKDEPVTRGGTVTTEVEMQTAERGSRERADGKRDASTLWRRLRLLFARSEGKTPRAEEFNESLFLTVDAEQLQNVIVRQIRGLAAIEREYIYVAASQDSAGPFSLIGGSDREIAVLPTLSGDSRTIRWFAVNREFLSFSDDHDVVRYMGSEIDALRQAGVNLGMPLTSRDRLIGVAFLRLPDGTLDTDGFANLRNLSRQAGLAFENALLFKERLRQNERLFRAEQLATLG